jgi:tRNA nucleotidyltransferase/poly(A) polymerase
LTIDEIAPERILGEFDKIVKKGNALVGAKLLEETGLLEKIFKTAYDADIDETLPWNQVRTMGEFIYLLSKSVMDNPNSPSTKTDLMDDAALFYKKDLKGDIPTFKEIQALQQGIEKASDDPAKNRLIVNAMFGILPQSIESEILPNQLKVAVRELKSGKYPLSLKQLAVNGNDLMQLGLKGKEIGDTLKNLLFNVYSDNVPNEKEALLNFLKQN